MTIQDDFRTEIEAFLARHDMKPAAFGAQSLHDPKFVFDLREGRSPSIKTMEKVRAWMAEQDAAAGTAPEAGPPGAAPSPQPTAPTAAAPASAARKEPVPPRRSHGLRNTVLTLLAILVIAAGAAAVWRPDLLRAVSGVVPSLRAADTGNDGAVEQFSAVVAAVQNDFNDLRRRLDRLEMRMDQIEEGAGETGNAAAPDSGRLDMLEERIAALENRPQPESNTPAGPSPALTGRLDDLERRITGQENAPAVRPEELQALRDQVGQLQESVNELQTRQNELVSLQDEVTDLQDQLAGLTNGVNSISGLQAGIEQSAILSAFMRLDADVRSGGPYEASLALYQRQLELQEDNSKWPSAQPLEERAATGIATPEGLTDRLDALIPRIIAGQEEGASWTDRLLSRLKGIVIVRKTGEQEGDAPDAIAARAETRLASGDLEGAVAEIESLPEGRKAVAADWLSDAHARIETLNALKGMATALSTAQGS